MAEESMTCVTPSARLIEELMACCRCCKSCRTETDTDRLMQIEPSEAPLQPSILLDSPKNLLKR